jgi:hypothetical protein
MTSASPSAIVLTSIADEIGTVADASGPDAVPPVADRGTGGQRSSLVGSALARRSRSRAATERVRVSVSSTDEGLGFGFYAKLAGLILVIGIGVFIAFLIFARAIYAWGFFGAFLVIAIAMLAFGWLYDRRHPNG